MFWPINQSNLKPLKHTAALNPESLPETTPKDFEFDYIDIGSVTYGKGIIEKQKMIFADAPSRARKPVKENDLIISTVRTYLRAIAMISEADSGNIASTGFVVCRPKEGTLPAFLYYAVHSQPFIEQVVALSTGMSYPAINPSTLGDIKLPFPKPEQQTAIARFLERETSRIDGLIEKKGRFIELLKEKRAALITHAVTKGIDAGVPMKDSGVDWIGQVPAHWSAPRIATLFREAFRPADPSLPVLSVSIHNGVTDGELSDDERDRKVNLSEDRTKYQGVEPGDLVYNMMRAWQGAFGAVSVKGLVSPAYVVASPITPFRTKFIEHLLHTKSASEEIRRFSKGIADFRMRLYWEHFRALRVALPPLDEQDKILAAIDRETARVDGLIAKTDRSIELLKEKRSALITAAVTGKIDVRNAA